MPLPATDDESLWSDFVRWLETAEPPPDVRKAMLGFRAHLLEAGVSAPDADARMGQLFRLFRARQDGWRLFFNRIYSNEKPEFVTKPNALLAWAIENRQPGAALDVGMGQGRNAVFLAMRGWDTTGFDVSEQGIAVARRQAERAGVAVTAVRSSDAEFDYGEGRWDLVAIIYALVPVADPRYAERVVRSLRPGGLVVTESFASRRDTLNRRPVDIDPADLRAAYSSLSTVRFEEVSAVPDWPGSDAPEMPVVRFVGGKAD